jgi:hypothetical protein
MAKEWKGDVGDDGGCEQGQVGVEDAKDTSTSVRNEMVTELGLHWFNANLN